MKIKRVKCKECGSINNVHFCIANDDTDKFATVNHRGRRISDSGNVGSKVPDLHLYDLHFCECHGECNDEMRGSDVELTLENNSTVTGDVKAWEYIKNN